LVWERRGEVVFEKLSAAGKKAVLKFVKEKSKTQTPRVETAKVEAKEHPAEVVDIEMDDASITEIEVDEPLEDLEEFDHLVVEIPKIQPTPSEILFSIEQKLAKKDFTGYTDLLNFLYQNITSTYEFNYLTIPQLIPLLNETNVENVRLLCGFDAFELLQTHGIISPRDILCNIVRYKTTFKDDVVQNECSRFFEYVHTDNTKAETFDMLLDTFLLIQAPGRKTVKTKRIEKECMEFYLDWIIDVYENEPKRVLEVLQKVWNIVDCEKVLKRVYESNPEFLEVLKDVCRFDPEGLEYVSTLLGLKVEEEEMEVNVFDESMPVGFDQTFSFAPLKTSIPKVVPEYNLEKFEHNLEYNKFEDPILPKHELTNTKVTKQIKYNSVNEELCSELEILKKTTETTNIERLYTLSRKYPVNALDKSGLEFWSPFTILEIILDKLENFAQVELLILLETVIVNQSEFINDLDRILLLLWKLRSHGGLISGNSESVLIALVETCDAQLLLERCFSLLEEVDNTVIGTVGYCPCPVVSLLYTVKKLVALGCSMAFEWKNVLGSDDLKVRKAGYDCLVEVGKREELKGLEPYQMKMVHLLSSV
jgi:hypothetical protein